MIKDLVNLFYPEVCACCDHPLSTNENLICTPCLHQLPLTNNYSEKESTTKKVLYGRVKIENAASLLLFEKKGPVQKLVHNLKYKGQQEIGTFLGKWLGEILSETNSYSDITAVVPVPLHKKRLKKRGYNQVTRFGLEIAKKLNVDFVENVLIKKTDTSSQTYKERIARWGKMEETFNVQNPHLLKGAHVLLVDDLITTGATLEACCIKLEEIPNIKISIATMAIAG